MNTDQGERRPAAYLWIAAGLAWLFIGVLALLPLAEALGVPGAFLIRLGGSEICHQIPERSLAVAGGRMAVCTRCFGLYLGGALTLVVAAIAAQAGRRILARRALLLLVVPCLLDALAQVFFGAGLPNFPRLWLSIPAGLALGVFLAEGIDDLVRSSRSWGRVVQEENS